MDRIDVSDWGIFDDGDHFTITFIGTAPFSSVGPWPRNPDTSIAAPRDGAIPELRYEWRDDGTTHILFDGPVAFESLKHGQTPMDARADAEIILVGHHILTAGDVVL